MRLLLAFIFLWHGVPKAIYVSWAMDKFVGFGLPGILGPITGWVEVIASIGLTVQFPKGMQAGLERDLLILAGHLVLILTGPGRLALDANRHQDTVPSEALATSS